MTTPVLTKKQQRHSLSAKKGPVKGLRNILAQPSPNFWPVIDVNQYPELVRNLNTILPSIPSGNNRRIPKYILKNVLKKDRALARKEILEKASPKPDILKFMIMGINIVTRALEKNNVCCVLLDANVEPPLIIKHIITMAVNKEIPVLLLPILRTVTLEKMRFATTAFALKQEVMQCPENVCHPLYKSIVEAFKDFESPKCLFQCFKSNEMSDKSTKCEEKIVDCDPVANISKPEKPVTIFTAVYKYRSSQDERAFIPPAINESSQIPQTSSDEFVALKNDLDPTNDEKCSSTLKNERYWNVDIGKSEKHAEKSKDTEKNQSFNKLKLINDTDSSKHTKNMLKRHSSDEPNYLSLKVKRIQGSNKRRKATKLDKKTKMKKQ